MRTKQHFNNSQHYTFSPNYSYRVHIDHFFQKNNHNVPSGTHAQAHLYTSAEHTHVHTHTHVCKGKSSHFEEAIKREEISSFWGEVPFGSYEFEFVS